MSVSCHILMKKCRLGENYPQKHGGWCKVYICTGLVTACRTYFYHCDMSLWSISNRKWVLIVGHSVLALLHEEFLLVAVIKDCAGLCCLPPKLCLINKISYFPYCQFIARPEKRYLAWFSKISISDFNRIL